ncbi:MAG: hypothetical protein MJA30_19770 [Cytophagales bacterium]|nr:hypothetical protein [Cytophagales bacterium]
MSVKLKEQQSSTQSKKDLVDNLVSKNLGNPIIACIACIGEGDFPG